MIFEMKQMTQKIAASLISLVLILFFAVPVFVSAQDTTVTATPPEVPYITAPVGTTLTQTSSGQKVNTGITYDCANENQGVAPGNCTFADLVAGTMRVINFGTEFALEFSVVVLAYAGFKYMISGDVPKARSEANHMFESVAIGIIVILCAWLIVNLIVSQLVNPAILQNAGVSI